MRLSENFTLAEMLASQTATRKNISEQFKPSQEVINNLKELCVNLLQPIRNKIGRSIIVTSGYRCERLNSAIRGSKTSQHMKGEAADIRAVGMSIEDLYQSIKKSGLKYDQLIQEFDSWIHISYSSRNRMQNLRAKKINGRTRYFKD